MASIEFDRNYFDRQALAKELRCSVRTVARLERLPNGLPSVVIGGRKYYRVSSVQSWLEKREQVRNPLRTFK